jgi:flagellar biosynthetic protein FlhB
MNNIEETYNPFLADLNEFHFDLQLFAPEDDGKTEEPTEKKISEERDKGRVAKSQELPQAFVVIIGILVVLFVSSYTYDSMFSMTRYFLSSFSKVSITERQIAQEFIRIVEAIGVILFPVFIATMIAAIFGNIIQVGFQINNPPLKVDFSKIKFDPASIMKKIFFSKQVGMNLFKSIFKVLAIGSVAYLIISADFGTILNTPDLPIKESMQIVLISGLKIIIWTSVLLLVLSIPDYIFEKKQLLESLKMSKHEIKEEMKETMGDPHIRARLKEMQRDLVMRNMITEVPNADVVVTNPTHFAVALKYDPEAMEAPTVIAKGADSIALKIREIARENSITMIENRPLAQEMYKTVEIGDIIPEDLFYAVSLIYAELHKTKQYQTAM